jgi:hypothetical protein
MGRGDRHHTIIFFKKATVLFIGITLVISLFVTFLWALGVPGVQNEYAKGWALGLKTLFQYFIGSGILLIIYAVVAKISQKFHAVLPLNLMIVSIFWIFFSYSAFQLYLAVKIMISVN